MKPFWHELTEDHGYSEAALRAIQNKFKCFRSILDGNNKVLKVIADMEEKSQGEYLFDINYIRKSLARINADLRQIIDQLIVIGGHRYWPLMDRYEEIEAEIKALTERNHPIERDDYTIPFEDLHRNRSWSVGSKSAQLGEMKAVLGLPVPDGFAISAWAYKHFVDSNNLQERISECIESLDLKSYDDLERVSERIRQMVMSSKVPPDLAEAIRKSHADLAQRTPYSRFSMRSSAIGEDTLFSFAGQYATFLNVRGEELVDRYRDVLASKFTPKAIYYFLSHQLSEAELAMSVGCVAMIDSIASGVIYSKDPVRPADGCMLVNSIFGLGKYLVDGTLTPDVFRVSRADGTVQESLTVKKPVRLTINEQGGTGEEKVPEAEQEKSSIGEDHIKQLVEFALKIEEHYGSPQDIEWAIDRNGRLFLLQTRPLRVMDEKPNPAESSVSELEPLITGGVTVCPGAGAGEVFHVSSTQDLPMVPYGAVVVAHHPFPGMITVMGKISALVTEVGGAASHLATLAREYHVPTIMGVERCDELPAGELVTVDATGAAVYAGIHSELIETGSHKSEFLDDFDIFHLLKEILIKISPLNLINISDPGFTYDNCSTYHDITRFAHQKAIEEMFTGALNLENKDRVSRRLKTDIPLKINIIHIDQDFSAFKNQRWIEERELTSEPMVAFWSGILDEGRASHTPLRKVKGIGSVLATPKERKSGFSRSSYAIVSREYMILSLRMGYHFSTIEAMCTGSIGKNYIRVQYKAGGATLERRVRRIKLLSDILSRMSFDNSSKADALDASITYQSHKKILEKLRLLGRITLMTKQLDMALSSDEVARWYTEDFLEKLGLKRVSGGVA